MLFVNPFFLTAAALVGVPILLHLWMRQKPQKVMFPALRFLKSREKSQKRTLLLRHLLLLLLRVMLILLLVLIFSRPSIRLSGRLARGEAATAVIMLFDTSLRMEYRHENHTRLEQAREIAEKLVMKLPRESQIAVVGTRPSVRGFIPDRAEVVRQISRLETASVGHSLLETLHEVLPLFEKSELQRRELYIFTDMTETPWAGVPDARTQELLAKYPDVTVYVMDVGVNRVLNETLDVPVVPGTRHGADGMLHVKSRLTVQDGRREAEENSGEKNGSALSGAAGVSPDAVQKNVTLYMLDADGAAQKRGEISVFAHPGEAAEVEFMIGGLMPGPNQGFLEIAGTDALACDNRRYFTVEVMPAMPVLLVTPEPAEEYAFFARQALAPSVFEREGRARFLCDVLSQEEFTRILSGTSGGGRGPRTESAGGVSPERGNLLGLYRAIFFIDPKAVPAGIWQTLFEQVNAGKGLGVFLGPNAADVEAFNGAEAQQLLPAKLEFQARRPGGVFFAPSTATQHPVMREFSVPGVSMPWMQIPVFRYWQLGKWNRGVQCVLTFTGGDPAILEQRVGAGRVLFMSTPPCNTQLRGDGTPQWNLLAQNGGWVFVMMMNQMAEWLSGESETAANVFVGTPFSLSTSGGGFDRYTLQPFPQTEAAEDITFPADPREHAVDVSGVERPGNYRVYPSESSARGEYVRGFSANTPPGQTDLTKISPGRLQEVFGGHPFFMAKNLAEMEREVSVAQTGVELFTPLAVLLVIFMAAEIWLENRFYSGKKERGN